MNLTLWTPAHGIGQTEYKVSCLGGLGLLDAARGDDREPLEFYEQALSVYADIESAWGAEQCLLQVRVLEVL